MSNNILSRSQLTEVAHDIIIKNFSSEVWNQFNSNILDSCIYIYSNYIENNGDEEAETALRLFKNFVFEDGYNLINGLYGTDEEVCTFDVADIINDA